MIRASFSVRLWLAWQVIRGRCVSAQFEFHRHNGAESITLTFEPARQVIDRLYH